MPRYLYFLFLLTNFEFAFAQYDPNAAPTGCSTTNTGTEIVTECVYGNFRGHYSNWNAYFRCPPGHYISQMVGRQFYTWQYNVNMGGIRFICSDGSNSGNWGDWRDTYIDWTGPSRKIYYVSVNSDSVPYSTAFFGGLQYDPGMPRVGGTGGSPQHARDAANGCLLVGMRGYWHYLDTMIQPGVAIGRFSFIFSCSICSGSQLQYPDRLGCYCRSGTYLSGSSCIACPSNSVCSATGFTCNSGYGVNAAGTGCELCGGTTYQSGTKCVACPSGAVCTSTAFTCKPGFQLVSGACSACPAGTTKTTTSNTDRCLGCPLNSACNSTTFLCSAGFTLNGAQCESCQSNTYKSSVSNSPCTACPSNTVCTTTSFTCLPGYGFNNVSNTCVACSSNTFKVTTSNTICSPCPINTVCNATSYSCAPGFGFNNTLSTCVSCANGTFKSSASNGACLSCPSNTICLKNGYSCLPGFGFNGSSLNSTEVCSSCPNNTYKSATLNSPCNLCPDGSLCSSTNFTCLAGYGYEKTFNSCRVCKNETYKSITANVPCTKCPIGSVCNSTMFLCEAGFQVNNVNQTCEPCPENTFKPASGNQECLPCPENAICKTQNYTSSGVSLDNDAYAGATEFACLEGFIRDEIDFVCKLPIPQCDNGYEYDPRTQKCEISPNGGGTTANNLRNNLNFWLATPSFGILTLLLGWLICLMIGIVLGFFSRNLFAEETFVIWGSAVFNGLSRFLMNTWTAIKNAGRRVRVVLDPIWCRAKNAIQHMGGKLSVLFSPIWTRAEKWTKTVYRKLGDYVSPAWNRACKLSKTAWKKSRSVMAPFLKNFEEKTKLIGAKLRSFFAPIWIPTCKAAKTVGTKIAMTTVWKKIVSLAVSISSKFNYAFVHCKSKLSGTRYHLASTNSEKTSPSNGPDILESRTFEMERTLFDANKTLACNLNLRQSPNKLDGRDEKTLVAPLPHLNDRSARSTISSAYMTVSSSITSSSPFSNLKAASLFSEQSDEVSQSNLMYGNFPTSLQQNSVYQTVDSTDTNSIFRTVDSSLDNSIFKSNLKESELQKLPIISDAAVAAKPYVPAMRAHQSTLRSKPTPKIPSALEVPGVAKHTPESKTPPPINARKPLVPNRTTTSSSLALNPRPRASTTSAPTPESNISTTIQSRKPLLSNQTSNHSSHALNVRPRATSEASTPESPTIKVRKPLFSNQNSGNSSHDVHLKSSASPLTINRNKASINPTRNLPTSLQMQASSVFTMKRQNFTSMKTILQNNPEETSVQKSPPEVTIKIGDDSSGSKPLEKTRILSRTRAISSTAQPLLKPNASYEQDNDNFHQNE